MHTDPGRDPGTQHRHILRWAPTEARARGFPPRQAPIDLLEASDASCLILLGGPGSGKTWEVNRYREALRARGEWVDLIAGRNLGQLPDIAANLPVGTIDRWKGDGGTWRLIIDGVDEIGSEQGAKRLLASLDALQAAASPGGLLRVVMTCRTAAWSSTLDEAIAGTWPAESVLKLAIEPLSDQDVRDGVAGVEPDPSRREHLTRLLLDESLRSIAGRPLLLSMLLANYRADGVLPDSRGALFQVAVETMLVKASVPGPVLDLSQKLLLAARIATACTFSGMRRLASGTASNTDDCIVVNSIAGGSEPSSLGSFAVSPAGLVQVLGSGLFIEVRSGVYEFRDRALCEFLTARYLVAHRLSSEEVMSLLAVREVDGPGGVAPQLHEVAAWAAAMMPNLFEVLVRREPEILLKSDAAVMSPSDRARITAAVLDRIGEDDLLERRDALVPLFARFDNEELAGQVERIIVDAEAPGPVRMVAIDIAAHTGKTALLPTLLSIAADASADVLVCTWAVLGVSRLGTESDIGALARILSGDLSRDIDDRLRGALLLACWPKHLRFGQLLNALTPIGQRDHIGTYSLFLRRLRIPDLTPDEAQQAVEWLRSRAAAAGEWDDGLQFVANRLFWAIAVKIEARDVRSALAELVAEVGFELSKVLTLDREEGEGWPDGTHARTALVIETLERKPRPNPLHERASALHPRSRAAGGRLWISHLTPACGCAHSLVDRADHRLPLRGEADRWPHVGVGNRGGSA